MRRIVSCYFAGGGSGNHWPRMARVLAHTASLHCPGWRFVISQLQPPLKRFRENSGYLANTVKLAHWCESVNACADGDEALLIDADAFIVRPLDDLWLQPFDVAYTVRPPGYPMPLNAGVVFLRVSDTTRRFMATWRDRNQQMLTDRALFARWQKYSGINQRALGSLLEERIDLGHLLPLPCHEWNCEDSAWETFDPEVTRIVHVKSALRRAVFPPVPRANKASHLGALATRWRDIEAESRRCE